MEPIRVVLGDDHPLVREGTRRILEQQLDLAVVGEASDGEQVLNLITQLQPDVAVLDIRMPRLSGIEVVRQMRQSSPHTRALMLTAYDDEDYVGALMEAGASGYLLKTVRANELVDAIHSIHQGEHVLHPAIAAKVAALWVRQRATHERDAPERLSPREREVADMAAKGLRNKAIAEGLGISVRTVEGHVNSVLSKLHLSSRLELVLYAMSHHWVKLDDEDQP